MSINELSARRWGAGIALAVGTAVTLGLIDLPGFQSAYRAPSLQVALETAGAVIALVVAYIVYGRFRDSGRPKDLLLVAAMASISFTNLFFRVVPDVASQSDAGEMRTWAALPGSLIGALLLTAAAFVSSARLKAPRRAAALLACGLVLAFASLWISVAFFGNELPAGVDPTLTAQEVSYSYLRGNSVVSILQFVGMLLYIAAAIGFSRRADRKYEFKSWLAMACSFAALASLNYGLFPSLHTDWVFIGDVFRFLFYVVIMIGAFRVIFAYWHNLAGAAVLEERGRLAREIHDGLAQELAFIARRAAKIGANGNGSATQIAAAAQRALIDSRLAISALTRPGDETLDVSIAKAVRDAAARVGATVSCELAPGLVVEPEGRDALVRIATEAVSNAGRYADGKIRVELTNGGPGVRLRVVDDGKGFDPDSVMTTTDSGFGLISMRDRASALGADFHVTSQIGEGTEVEVVLPT